MKRLSHVLSIVIATAVAASCSGDGPSTPAAANITLTPSASAVTASDPLGLRLGGSRVDSLGVVTASGTAIGAGLDGDSVVRILMPLGPSGPVTLTVNAWSGRQAVTASATVQRTAAVAVADENAFVTTALATIAARLDAAAAGPVPADVNAADFTADIATLRRWSDSLETLIAGLDPAARTLALTMMAESDARAQGAADAALLDVLAANCTSWRLSLDCVARARDRLTQANASTQARLAYTVGVTAIAVVAFTAAPVVAAIAGTVALYNYVKSGSEFADYITSTVEEVTAPAVRMLAELDDSDGLRTGDLQMLASVDLPTFRPDVPVTIPVVRQTRNALPSDGGLASVGTLPSLIAGVRNYWDQLMDLLPVRLRVRPPALPATPTRLLREPAEPGEVQVVSVLAGGVPATGITAAISDGAGSVRLALSGDPGEGRDLTVRLALDGDGAGRVEFNIALRYESAPACPTILTDDEGNEYGVAQFESLCWMTENLRSTSGIPRVTDAFEWTGYVAGNPFSPMFVGRTTPALTSVNRDPSNDATLGLLYNQFAARIACPAGWRLPSAADWNSYQTQGPPQVDRLSALIRSSGVGVQPAGLVQPILVVYSWQVDDYIEQTSPNAWSFGTGSNMHIWLSDLFTYTLNGSGGEVFDVTEGFSYNISPFSSIASNQIDLRSGLSIRCVRSTSP